MEGRSGCQFDAAGCGFAEHHYLLVIEGPL